MAELPVANGAPVGPHRLKTRHQRGSILEFQDRSRWEISPGHEIFTNHWAPESDITIVPGGFPEYPYDLINPKSGDRVPARFCGNAESVARWRLIDH